MKAQTTVKHTVSTIAALLLASVPAPFLTRAETAPPKMDAGQAQKSRYDGKVAIWYSSVMEAFWAHDWDPIKDWNGPYHPLLGYYKSDDPEVVRQHLRWLRRAGVDVIVYDVVRVQPELTILDIAKQKTLQLLVEELSHQENEPRKLQLVIWMELYYSNPTDEQYRFGLDYVRKSLADRDFYYRLNNKPLVVRYINGRRVPSLDAIDKEYQSFFTLRSIAPGGGSNWNYLSGGNRECMTAIPSADCYMEEAYIDKCVRKKTLDVAALRQHGQKVIEQRADGRKFENELLKARQVNPEIIFISGWNDWAYCLQIEPAVEYGFKYVDIAARLLGRETETAPYRQPLPTGQK